MTVVCYKAGIIAADRLATNHGTRVGYVTKIFRTPRDGMLCGVAGGALDHFNLKAWAMIHEADVLMMECPPLRDGRTEMVAVKPDGSSYLLTGDVDKPRQPIEFGEGFPIATGSGMDLAIGAMAQGATAIEAALIASRFDVYCGGGVDWLDHDGNGGRVDG